MCFLALAPSVFDSLSCPHCQKYLATPDPEASAINPVLPAATGLSINAKYSSDEGEMEDVDLLPILTEEAFVLAHPEAVSARAVHDYCDTDDLEGLTRLLVKCEKMYDEGHGLSPPDVLGWQNPLDEMRSALHVAVEGCQTRTLWFLLYVSSNLPLKFFPPDALKAAEELGVNRRPKVKNERDIRHLRTTLGQTAEDMAREKKGAILQPLVDQGIFRPPTV